MASHLDPDVANRIDYARVFDGTEWMLPVRIGSIVNPIFQMPKKCGFQNEDGKAEKKNAVHGVHFISRARIFNLFLILFVFFWCLFSQNERILQHSAASKVSSSSSS